MIYIPETNTSIRAVAGQRSLPESLFASKNNINQTLQYKMYNIGFSTDGSFTLDDSNVFESIENSSNSSRKKYLEIF